VADGRVSMSDIEHWLAELELAEYTPLFEQNDIDLDVLCHLTEDDLKDLGISLGHRKKLLAAINRRATAEPPPPTPLVVSPGGRPDDAVAAEAERRQLTVMFCDLADSTALSGQMDPEAFRTLILAYQDACTKVIDRHDGFVARYLGDGMLAYFGYPTAHEDDAERAVRSGLEVVQAIETLSRESPDTGAFHLAVRVGIATGLVVVGDIVGEGAAQESTVLGETPNVAARLQSLAAPNTVVVSDDTHRLVEGMFVSDELGRKSLKGLSKAIAVHRVRAEKGFTSRFGRSLHRGLSRFVGRERELERLLDWWHEDIGRARMVDILGEAGIGKSRLIHEFCARADPDKAFFLRGHCISDGHSTPYLPFIEIVRTAFRLDEDDGEPEAKIERGLELLGLDREDNLAYVLHLLGRSPPVVRTMDAEIVGLRTRLSMQNLLRARCRLSPVVMIVEDLHWADSATEELLQWAVETDGSLALFIICSCRPDHPLPWTGRDNVKELRLDALSRASTIDLVESRLHGQALSTETMDLVLEKADGNPLFAEEISTYIQESDRPGDVLPATVENLLMDKVGRLPEGPRNVLQAASIIGRRFSVDLVREVSQLNGKVPDWIHELEGHDLVFREADRNQFRFKHALVRDAVYQNLLKERREELHERLAARLEEIYAGHLGEVADSLAGHYCRTRLTDKAVRYLAMAGEKSLALYSLDEAETRFEAALELMRAEPDCADDVFLADLLLKIARVYYFRVDFKSIIELVEEYLPRVEALNDRHRLARFLFETGYAHVFGARQNIGKPLLERALAIGEEIDDEESIAYACMGLMWHYICWEPPGPGRSAMVQELGERALAAGKRIEDVWVTSKVLLALANEAGFWGRIGESERLDRKLLELSEETGDPRPRAMGLFRSAYGAVFSGRLQAGLDYAEEAVRSSISPIDRLYGRLAKASALVMLGRAEEAHSQFGNLRRELESGQMRITELLASDLPYGLAMVLTGRLSEGVRWIEATMERFASWGQPFARAWGHLYLGQIFLEMAKGGDPPSLDVIKRNLVFLIRTVPIAGRLARRHLEKAVSEFRGLDNPYGVAESLFHLGRLHKLKRRPKQAHACFGEARERASSAEATALCKRIDAELEASI